MTTVLAAGAVCRPGPLRPGWVAITEGRIVEMGTGPAPRGARDLGAAVLAPGYIDLQVNGVELDDLATTDAAGWRRAGAVLARHGVTAYCATLVSAALDAYANRLDSVAAARDDAATHPDLAAIVGVHLEGPFLGAAPGAHPTEMIRSADLAWLARMLEQRSDLVRMVTLAPEADPDLAATTMLARAGVVVALGHSRATYAEACAAADAGATVVTHLFNAMGPLHHREPGLVGAALDDERLTPTLIADLVHVHPAALRLAVARKPNVALISDSVAPGGSAREADGAARLTDGTLSGATCLLDDAVANVVAAGVPVERAVELATRIPADLLGLGDRGRVAVGGRADLVALDPSNLAVQCVWIDGDEVSGATPRGAESGVDG